jgi:predicted phage terminase large subunit-like protein
MANEWESEAGYEDQFALAGVTIRRTADRTCSVHAESLAKMIQADLLTWGRYFLPEHFRLQASAMHGWLAEQFDEARRTSDAPRTAGCKINVVGPRGSAKSTLSSLAFVLREALARREPYIWIVSDTRHQAAAHLENLKTELTENRRLRAAYPAAAGMGPIWRAGAIVLRNGVMIEAFGTGQRIRGRRRREHRPTLIVCDDLQNDGHIQSALARERSRAWFHGMLMKAGTKSTTIVNLGTALHRECLAMELHRTPGWNSRLFRAIQQWPIHMPLWHAWEELYCDANRAGAAQQARAFYDRNRLQMDDGAELLWPEHEDLYTLMCMRSESGSTAFEREKQSTPVNPELCEWPESYFGDWVWFDEWPAELRLCTMALDPSKGSDARRGDYSAFVMLGVAHNGLLYLEADLARRPTPQIVEDGVELCRRFRPHAFGIEVNQFQELLGADFAAEFIRQGMIGITPCSIENRTSKPVRIRRLGPLLAARRLRFKTNSPGTRMLIDQLKDFPIGDHDDGPDAAEMALRLAEVYLQPAPPSDGLGSRLIF